MNATLAQDATLIEVLREHLRACTSTSDGFIRPDAILWTDPKEQWRSLIPTLLEAIPELLVYGEYDPESRTGPAIWLRCVIDRALETPALAEDVVPIIYLPGIGRQDLRAGEACPDAIKPLVELMYRGTLWVHKGGHDWTATAFITSPDALELDLSGDDLTTEAMIRALPEFANEQLGQFRGHRLEADDFDKMLASDVIRDLLLWMNDPQRTRERMGADRWAAFVNQCKQQFDFHPDTDGETIAGERLGAGEGDWSKLWQRFEEAPKNYPGIPDLLRRSKPGHILTLVQSRWPDVNEEEEEAVRRALTGLKECSHADACAAILDLESQHAARRSWIWSRLGHSPMAMVLEPLAVLAKHAKTAIGGKTPGDIARTYVESGWQADLASWQALAMVSAADEGLVRDVVQRLLEPWLDECARAFQESANTNPLPDHATADAISVADNTCLLFTDGLRYDLGESLRDKLESQGCRVRLGHRWSALPTVTATAKPAVTPIASQITGGALPEDFAPIMSTSKKPANAPALRSALEASGYQVLSGSMTDWPSSDDARGWVEEGKFDTRGHQLQGDLARHLDEELDRLTNRITSLLDAGWASVRVVTDHGWLLLPKGLPKVDLPAHLTASKWARCATIAGNSQVDMPTSPWHWNTAQYFATAPGIACFTASNCYAHGGISIQECLIPDLHVERAGDAGQRAAIQSVTWKGMRCFVVGESGSGEVQADLRLTTANGTSVAAAGKTLDADGSTSLLLEDDQYESADLVVVLLGGDGTVLAQHKTKVGSDS